MNFNLAHIRIYLEAQLPLARKGVFLFAVLTYPVLFSPGIWGWIGVPSEWRSGVWLVSQLACAVILAASAPYWILRKIDLTDAPETAEHEREPGISRGRAKVTKLRTRTRSSSPKRKAA